MKAQFHLLSVSLSALALFPSCESNNPEKEYDEYMKEKDHIAKHVEEDRYEAIHDSLDFKKFENDRKEHDRRRRQRDAKWDRRWESWTSEGW